MLGFSKGKAEADPALEPKRRGGLFQRLKRGLSRTRGVLMMDVRDLFSRKRRIDASLIEDIETHLLMADVGVEATQEIIAEITASVRRKQLADPAALLPVLREVMVRILAPRSEPLVVPEHIKPYVILVVGVNGSGKTTTIGKLAKRLQTEGKRVLLAAGDTFRAAAVEQLQVWGERNSISVISQDIGADSASVIYDAVAAANARSMDVIIADTAGRLHTKQNLMEELKKVKRVIAKLDGSAPHEVMLVLDACTGQNGLVQAARFHEAVGVTGITLTKMDGTAKGGIIFAIAKQLSLPIRFIGVGEAIDDLRPFDATEFVEALLDFEEGS